VVKNGVQEGEPDEEGIMEFLYQVQEIHGGGNEVIIRNDNGIEK